METQTQTQTTTKNEPIQYTIFGPNLLQITHETPQTSIDAVEFTKD